jgi:5-methylcytosine-specific restriction endonuclease McrA
VVHSRTLLLNSTYEPLLVLSWQRAVTMLLLEKVEVLENYSTVLHAVSFQLPMPAVVRLNDFVRRRRMRIALSRRNVFYRDGHRCQYCRERFPARELTCDHVKPRSQGGSTSWENMVTACGPCNRKKGGRTPEQARMSLAMPPGRPESLPIEFTLNVGQGQLPDAWRRYLNIVDPMEAVA